MYVYVYDDGMSLTHRLQLLLEESQYEQLAIRARNEGRSVGSLVREAIDLTWPDPGSVRRAAASVILNAVPMDVPDVDGLKRELDAARAERFA